MDIFSKFCNICYKYDDGSLTDIAEESLKYLKDTLFIFVGHLDIIGHNTIYLCQLCCDELTRFGKFRKICFSNLVNLRQRYFNMKSKLELEEDAMAVKNTLLKFVQEKVLQRNTLAESNPSVSTDFNKKDSVFYRQVINIKSERNDFDGDWRERSDSAGDVVASTNESDMTNKILRPEGINLEKFPKESEYFDVPDVNNTVKSEFIKKEYEFENNEIARSNLDGFTLKNIENESSEHVNSDYNSDGSVILGIQSKKQELHMNEENGASKGLKMEKTETECSNSLHADFEFVNVCTTMNMQNCGDSGSKSEQDAQVGMKLPSNSCYILFPVDRQPIAARQARRAEYMRNYRRLQRERLAERKRIRPQPQRVHETEKVSQRRAAQAERMRISRQSQREHETDEEASQRRTVQAESMRVWRHSQKEKETEEEASHRRSIEAERMRIRRQSQREQETEDEAAQRRAVQAQYVRNLRAKRHEPIPDHDIFYEKDIESHNCGPMNNEY